MYHYAGNNPVTYTDPNGESDFWGPFTGSSIKWAGNKIHRTVQEKLKDTYGGAIAVLIPGAGRADYILENEIYEIKPNTQFNIQYGKDQLQNYVEHSELGTEKGTSLLTKIPEDIHIKNLVLLNTKKLKITCDVACLTSSKPEQAGMIYYIPYNWRIEKKSKLTTSALISLAVFGYNLATGATTAAHTAATVTEEATAACLIFVPTPLLNYYVNKTNIPDQI